MTTITWGTAEAITPELVTGYDPARELRTIAHDILGSPAVALTLRPAGLRTGTLELFFTTHAAAADAEAQHALPRVFTITDPPVPGMVLRYVAADGRLELRQAEPGMPPWLLRVPFREVP